MQTMQCSSPRQTMQCSSPREVAKSPPASESTLGDLDLDLDLGASSKAEYIKSTSSSSSSWLPASSSRLPAEAREVPTPAAPAPLPDSCGASGNNNDECDDSASTAASDVGDRWADLDSDEGEFAHDEQPAAGQSGGAGSSSGGSSPAAAPAAAPPLASAARKAKWADLADDSDEEVWGCTPPLAQEAVVSSAQQQDTTQLPTAGPMQKAASGAPKYREAKPEAKPKWGKQGRGESWTAASSSGSSGSTAVSLEGRPAGKAAHRAGKANSFSNSSEGWWQQQQQQHQQRWETKGSSSWWGSKEDAEWWGSSGGSAKDSWWSRQGDYASAGSSGGAKSAGGARSHQADRDRKSSMTQSSSAKPQCQFFLGIEEDNKFKVTRKVLGPHGQHMKAIAEASGAKLRLRGKGSGFLEGPEQRESADELMLCVSATEWEGYQEAVRLVTELMERVYEEYRTFCRKSGRAAPDDLEVQLHEGPRPGSR